MFGVVFLVYRRVDIVQALGLVELLVVDQRYLWADVGGTSTACGWPDETVLRRWNLMVNRQVNSGPPSPPVLWGRRAGDEGGKLLNS